MHSDSDPVASRSAHGPCTARGRPLRIVAIGGCLLGVVVASGCTDSFRVEAPYDWAWERAMTAMTDAGFEMVVENDEQRMIPASSAATGRAWFLGWPDPDAVHPSPRVISITIEPVLPPETAWRTVSVKAQDRSWVARAEVPDPEVRTRVTWILREALLAPGTTGAPSFDH
ncbi:MAG: hypothetical protein KF724_11115 [Phycisphaeraceae bacterium]|nr:hypothetical protein [Phycisphaeraceae bacterium]